MWRFMRLQARYNLTRAGTVQLGHYYVCVEVVKCSLNTGKMVKLLNYTGVYNRSTLDPEVI